MKIFIWVWVYIGCIGEFEYTTYFFIYIEINTALHILWFRKVILEYIILPTCLKPWINDKHNIYKFFCLSLINKILLSYHVTKVDVCDKASSWQSMCMNKRYKTYIYKCLIGKKCFHDLPVIFTEIKGSVWKATVAF